MRCSLSEGLNSSGFQGRAFWNSQAFVATQLTAIMICRKPSQKVTISSIFFAFITMVISPQAPSICFFANLYWGNEGSNGKKDLINRPMSFKIIHQFFCRLAYSREADR